jgi:hypothetical protein
MGQKSGYMLAELDARLARDDSATPSASQPAPAPQIAPQPRPNPSTAWRTDPPAPIQVEPNPPTRLAPPSGSNSTAYLPPLQDTMPSPRSDPGGAAGDLTDGLPPPQPGGYDIADIREAGRGVFGTLSSELAAVINYAFKSYGYPTAYVTGSEGGGALLAGLRWGKGELHTKQLDRNAGRPMPIHWRGPSLGFDFGASGANVMLLVYNLRNPGDMYETFTGVEGSAYIVGGFGLNVLKHRDVIIVPIRTGLGLRVGASVGYLKFTERSSWNPF